MTCSSSSWSSRYPLFQMGRNFDSHRVPFLRHLFARAVHHRLIQRFLRRNFMRRGGRWRFLERLDGQGHSEDTALAGNADEIDLASQQRRQFADNGKTESRAAESARVITIDLEKGFKDTLLHILGDADTAVLHRQRQLVPSYARSRNRHLAALGIF